MVRITDRGAEPREQSDPSWDTVAITPGTGALTTKIRGFYVGVGGTVVITDANGNDRTLLGVQTGSIIPIVCTHILAATTDSPPVSTTATDIVGLL